MDLSNQLKKCSDNLETLFRIYNDKAQWHSAYPLLVDTATRIENVFHLNQHAAIATLSINNANISYVSNLLNNQSILICVLCKISGLNRVGAVKLIQSAITHSITIGNELNLVAAKKPLNRAQHQQYKNRYFNTYQFIKPHLKKLPLLKTDLASKLKSCAYYSIDSQILRVSYTLAKAITCINGKPARMLREIIPTIYLKTQRNEDKKLLTRLGTIFNTPLPGEQISSDGQQLVVLGKISNEKVICYNRDSKSYNEVSTSVSVVKQRVLNNVAYEHYLNYWNKLPALIPVVPPPYINEYFNTNDLKVIRKAAFFSIGKLINELSKNSEAETLVLDVAQRFSTNPITDIRHAIALVGVEQLPELLENQQLLKRLASMGTLNWCYVENRVSVLIAFIESYKSIDPHFPCQKLINYALKHIAFTFKLYPHGIILPINTLTPRYSITDINGLVNFYTFHKHELPEQVKNNPFYQINQQGFKLSKGSTIHSACFLHLVLCNLVYQGQSFEALPAHIKQQMNYAQQQLQIENLDNYLSKLLDFSPVNRVL